MKNAGGVFSQQPITIDLDDGVILIKILNNNGSTIIIWYIINKW